MRTIEIEVAFELGQRVEFDNKIGKDEGVVTGYSIRKGAVSYAVCWSNKEEKWHYDFELKTKER